VPLTDADGIRPVIATPRPRSSYVHGRLGSQGVKIIRLLTSPRVRFSDAALRRELPELVRCAARGPASGKLLVAYSGCGSSVDAGALRLGA
jgi:hypothetical protein